MSSVSPADTAVAEAITAVIQRDPGGRGLARWASEGQILETARSLLCGQGIVITTGFCIVPNGVIETDGPIGSIQLARALRTLGKEVVLVVDDHAGPIFRVAAGDIPVRTLPPGDSPELRGIPTITTTHVVAVERPGRAVNGRYYNMRGGDVSAYVAATDELFLDPRRKYKTVAVGDGGNELGMAAVSEKIRLHVPNGERISCRTPADMCIYAGVSNWGAYGLCAMLSVLSGRCLLPEPAKIVEMLESLVHAGAVDGILHSPTMTVDGLPLKYEEETVERLRETAGVCHD